MGLGQFEEAAEWGVKAAARPNAHPHILACAAFALSLADRLVEAQGYIATVHKTLPLYHVDDSPIKMRLHSKPRSCSERARRASG